jgi:threonine/homoserine/homoserine lactone efflux protein
VDVGIVIQGAIVGLILAVPVGPLSLICIQRTLSGGKLHGLISGLGVTVADSVYALVAFLGLAVISGFIIGQEMALRIFAGLVLIAVGMRIIYFVPPSGQENTEDGSYLKDFLSMAAFTIANPMTLIFLMVTLPGYGLIFGGTSLTAAAAFVAGFFFGSAMWWVVLCGSIGSFRTRISAGNLTLINRASGIFIICVGAAMIISPVIALVGITVP